MNKIYLLIRPASAQNENQDVLAAFSSRLGAEAAAQEVNSFLQKLDLKVKELGPEPDWRKEKEYEIWFDKVQAIAQAADFPFGSEVFKYYLTEPDYWQLYIDEISYYSNEQ
jgi:hypothetical protein